MAEKKGYFQTTQDYIITVACLTAPSIAVPALWFQESILPNGLIFAAGCAGPIVLFQRSGRWRSHGRSAKLHHTAEGLKTQQVVDTDYHTAVIMRWKDRVSPLPQEFVFDGLGLPCPIDEGVLRDFLTIARKRQQLARYSKRSKIKMIHVMSQNHFVNGQPSFLTEWYNGCLIILQYSFLLAGYRSQGKANYLRGERSVSDMLDHCKVRWAKLTAPPPRPRMRFMELMGR